MPSNESVEREPAPPSERATAERLLTAHLEANGLHGSLDARRLVCSLVEALVREDASPEGSVIHLKSVFGRVHWPRGDDVIARQRAMAQAVGWCIDHYFVARDARM